MAKTLKEAALSTRNARAKLGQGLHWRGVDTDVHLGYRKGKRGGVWIVRWRSGTGYRQERLSAADDELSEGTLDYAAAVRAARQRVEAVRREDRARSDGVVQTVRSALESYTAMRDARDSERAGRQVRSTATYRLALHVLGTEKRGRREAIPGAPLADIALHDLDESKLKAWRAGLTSTMKAATRKRLIGDLKAALNAAFIEHRHKLPHLLPTIIKHGLAEPLSASDDELSIARDNQILPDDTIRQIIAAAQQVDEMKGLDGELFRMILVLAATGARFSQVARLLVRDLQADRSRLMMPTSRKGRGGKVEATPISIGADVLAELSASTADKAASAPLLLRWKYERVAGSLRWQKGKRTPWRAAYELLPLWAAILDVAGLTAKVIPYALRHSSIVRGIRAGLPVRLVAALHDTSVAMIERHYGRWIADGLDDLAAAAVVPLVRR